jgi:broad specificity phosphatase PhoE
MAKKVRKKYKEMDFDPYDEFDESFEEELDVKELSREIQSGEWDDYYEETEERFSARRKIERRNDMKKLYSQLDEWEQFGDRVDW